MRRFVCLVLIASSVGGCAFLRDLLQDAFVEPKLTFKSASLSDVTLGGATLNLIYSLENPNPMGLSLAEVDYRLTVEDQQVVAGKPPGGLQLPASGSADLTFPANLQFAALANVLQTFLSKDVARYAASGHIGVDTPIGVIRLPLEKKGDFEVPKLPEVRFADPKVSQVTFAGATVEFPLTVTNRNTFVLPVQKLTGQIQIAGASIGNVTAPVGNLESKTPTELTVPVQIRFAEAASAALAIQRGSAEVSFVGEVQSGAVAVPLRFTQPLRFRR